MFKRRPCCVDVLNIGIWRLICHSNLVIRHCAATRLALPVHLGIIAPMSNNPSPLVGIVIGSASDAPTMRKCCGVLDELKIPCELKICSAHRTPQRAHDYAVSAEERGIKVIVA